MHFPSSSIASQTFCFLSLLLIQYTTAADQWCRLVARKWSRREYSFFFFASCGLVPYYISYRWSGPLTNRRAGTANECWNGWTVIKDSWGLFWNKLVLCLGLEVRSRLGAVSFACFARFRGPGFPWRPIFLQVGSHHLLSTRISPEQGLSPAWHGPKCFLITIFRYIAPPLTLLCVLLKSGKLFFRANSLWASVWNALVQGEIKLLQPIFSAFKNPNWPSLRATEIVRLCCGGLSVFSFCWDWIGGAESRLRTLYWDFDSDIFLDEPLRTCRRAPLSCVVCGSIWSVMRRLWEWCMLEGKLAWYIWQSREIGRKKGWRLDLIKEQSRRLGTSTVVSSWLWYHQEKKRPRNVPSQSENWGLNDSNNQRTCFPTRLRIWRPTFHFGGEYAAQVSNAISRTASQGFSGFSTSQGGGGGYATQLKNSPIDKV